MNSKWYLLVDTKTDTAVEYLQIPDDWHDNVGMHQLDDTQLATLGDWSPRNRGYKFLTISVAKAFGVTNIDSAINVVRPEIKEWLRTMRDPLLRASDIVTMVDRWANLDVVAQSHVTKFRQALRDITEGDVVNVTWPIIPNELSYLKFLDLSAIKHPSQDFLNMLAGVNNVSTPDALITEQCERIKAERDRRKSGGIPIDVDGTVYWFWNDEPTRNQYAMLDSMIRRNNLPGDFVIDEWKTMDGTFVPMTVSLLFQIVDSGIQLEKQLFKAAENHRAALGASADPKKYDYHVNWPTTYEESNEAIAVRATAASEVDPLI